MEFYPPPSFFVIYCSSSDPRDQINIAAPPCPSHHFALSCTGIVLLLNMCCNTNHQKVQRTYSATCHP